MIKKIQYDFILHLNDRDKYIIIVQEYFVEIPRKMLEYFITLKTPLYSLLTTFCHKEWEIVLEHNTQHM